MADELRPDIRAAREGMTSKGARREIGALASRLEPGETVSLLSIATYGNSTGLLAFTDRRLLFLKERRRERAVTVSVRLAEISHMQWMPGMMNGRLSVIASGVPTVFTWIDKRDGERIAVAVQHVTGAAQVVTGQVQDVTEPRYGGAAIRDENSEATPGEMLGCLNVVGLVVTAVLAFWAFNSRSLWAGFAAVGLGLACLVVAVAGWVRSRRRAKSFKGDAEGRAVEAHTEPPVVATAVGLVALAVGSFGIGHLAWSRWVSCAPGPEADLAGCDLAGYDLAEADLAGADLSDADLSGADLSGADLAGADLGGGHVSDTVLSSADLSNANLSNLDLTSVALDGVTLAGADLTGADLTAIDLSGSELAGAILHEATLVGADLSDARLAEADLTGADLSDGDLTDAVLDGTVLSAAVLSGAVAEGVDLTTADLSDAVFGEADLSGANLAGVDLTGSDLSGSDLSSADLASALLSNADLSSASLASTVLTGSDLSGAALPDADLSAAVLDGADLGGAVLTRADLTDADLSGADLQSAMLDEADLTGAEVGSFLIAEASLVDVQGLADEDLAAGLGVLIEELAARLIDDNQRLESGPTTIAQLAEACTAGTAERVGYPVVDSGAVIQDEDGTLHELADEISSELDLTLPPAARMATLIVCVGASEDVLLETCEYSPTGLPPFDSVVNRYRQRTPVKVIDLRAFPDVSVRQTDVDGETPGQCPATNLFDFGSLAERIDGGEPEGSEIAAAVRGLL